MKYHKLDLLDFCDDKYSHLNHNEGIGGVGLYRYRVRRKNKERIQRSWRT